MTPADLFTAAVQEAVAPLIRQAVAPLEARLTAYIEAVDDDLPTAQALRLTGIGSRTTLIAERQRPGTLLAWRKEGTRALYSRRSCIDYKLARRLGRG